MADIQIAEGRLEVRLALWERICALHGNITVPRAAVRELDVVDRPFSALRGIRWPGTGIPGILALGTWRFDGGKDFVLLYSHQRAVEIHLVESEFARLLIGVSDPDAVASRLARAVR